MRIKRFISMILVVVLTVMLFPFSSSADDNISVSAGSSLADGYYRARISIDTLSEYESPALYGDLYRTVLIEVADGKENLTLRMGNYVDQNKSFRVLKEDYYESFKDEGKFKQRATPQSFSNEEIMEEKYWKNYDVSEDSNLGFADFCFEIQNPDQPVILAISNPDNIATSEYGNYILVVSIDYSMLERLPDLDSIQSEKWYLDFGSVSEGTPGSLSIASMNSYASAGAMKGLRALFSPEVSVMTNDKSSEVILTLSESGKKNLTSFYACKKKGDEAQGYKKASKNSNTFYLPARRRYYQEVTRSSDDTISLEFDFSNYNDLAFGIAAYIRGENHAETHSCSDRGKTFYYASVLIKTTETSKVHFETALTELNKDDESEDLIFKFDSTTVSAKSDFSLCVSRITEGAVYDAAVNHFQGASEEWRLYRIQILDSNGKPRNDKLIELSSLSIPVPTSYANAEVYSAEKGIGNDYAITQLNVKDINGSFSFDTETLGYYVISDDFSYETSGDVLTEDGRYNVNAVIYHMTRRNLSMANQALVKPVTVVVSNGRKYIYLEMGASGTGGATAYMGKLWFYKAGYTLKDTGYPEGDLQEAYIAEYQKTEAGEYILDGKHTGPSGYCGKKLFFELPDDNPVVPVQVYVSAMDTDYTNGRADCRLCLDYSSATKIDDTTELPTVETALRAAEEAAETAKEADYTSATYTALANAEATAKSVLDNAEATEEAQSDAYFALRDAIEALTPVENISLDDGLYTAAAKIAGGTDESIDAESRVLKSDDSCALRVTSDKITALRVYDPSTGEYKDAVKNESTNAFDVTVSGLSSETQVQYATAENPGDGDYTNGRISWTEDFTKAEISKTAFESSIKDAEELVEKAGKDADKYNADDVAALETALAAAHVTDQDSLAVQSEVDAANEALKAAAEQASLGANISDIKAVLDSVKALDETAYTPASWSALETAAAAANEVLADANAGKTVSAAKAAETLSSLNAAKDALITKGDKTALQALYDEASAIKDDGQEGYAAFRTALDNAKAVIDDENAAQSTVDAAKDTLELAVDNLYGGIDKTALQSSYDEINGKRTGGELDGYTDESLALLDAALTNASETLENANATQQEISGAAELLAKAQDALILKTANTDIPVGTYEITGRVRHASQDQDSMSNAALEEPLTIRVTEKEDGTKEARLYMNFRPLTILSMQGYLANLSYYPDAHDANTIPTTGAVAATTEETYTGVYDSYNDPENGTDANVKGKEYPKTMSIPLTWNDSLVWLQVYVPVMEGISRGTGTQNAKLVLDWSTLKQTAGAYDGDAAVQSAKASLAAAIDAANALKEEAASSDKWIDAEKNVLTAAIAAGNAAHDSLNLDADAVNKVTDAVTAAQNIFSTGSETADKTALKAAIDAANEKLGDKDHTWEPSGKAYLASVISGANTVYASSRASEGQIANWVNALKTATDNLRAVADKTALKAALDDTENYLKDTASYTAADLNALKKLYDDAEAVYEKDDVTQEEADAQANVLTSAVKNLKKVGDVKVVKDGLHDMIAAASGLAGNDAPYTDDSLENLNKAITAADKVYHDADATQEEVNAQSANLSEAIRALKVKKAAEPTKAPEPTVTPTPKPTDTPTPTPVKETWDMYRLYNPNSGEHFYTGNEAEKDGLVKLGWKYEGVGWKAPTSGKAVYRLYNPNAGDHHYTLSVTERDYLVSVGWKYEGIGWYSDPEESVPLYRQYNPNAKAGAHNFTTSKNENDYLVSLGWKQEGVGWYGVK